MAGTCPLSSNLVTQSVNFHGHQLLKQLTASHPKDIETLNLKEVDYNVCKARVPEIRKQGSLRQQELIHFITNKCQSLFVPREVNPLEDVGEDDYGMSDRRDRLPPVEYYMKVPKNIREDVFFKTVKRGHLLFVRVASYIHELLHCVKVQATLGNTVRDLFDTDIKAHLRLEDSQPEPVDQDNLGRWMLRTRLWVEVLEVDATDKYLLVGTNGVTIPPHMKDKIKLGKVTLNDRPAIISKMEDGTVAPYSEVLETLALYNNPRSIRHLASKFGINMFTHTSLMQTLRYKFPDREMYKNLRKAQMSRWAHKSVADGVVFFKRGQYEEAFQCLNKALQIDSENVEAFVAKGALLANLGRFEKAVEDFEQALKYNPKHSNACKYICETLVELGKQLEEADKMEEAEQKYKKCLEINPEHSAGLEAMNTLNRKLSRVKEQQTGDTELVQTVLRDLIEMEEEFKRKRHRTTSDSKSSPKSKTEAQPSRSTSSNPPKSRSQSKSLSPLSKKLALQEGTWHPPSSINTVQTYMEDCMPATMNVHPPPPPLAPSYGYPMTGWSPNAMNQMIHNPQVPPTAIFTQPPPGYPIIPPQGVSFDINYASREDEEYKARVDKFLKQLEGSRFGDKKDRGKKSSTRESRRRRKHSKDSHKKKSRRNRSRSRSRRSRNGSRSISYSSSSSTSSSSSSSSSSTSLSSSSTSGTSDSSSRKKYKKKKYKKREKKEKQSKAGKLHKEKLEEKSKYPSNYSKVEEDPIPELESLNEKLSAYYKKVEASRESHQKDKKTKENYSSEKEGAPEKPDSITLMMNVMKSYEQGFRLSKTKIGANSTPNVQEVHPVFRESEEEYEILDQPVKSNVSKDKSSVKMGKDIESPKIQESKSKSSNHSRSRSKSRSRSHSRSQYRKNSHSPLHHRQDIRSRSRSRSRCRRESRSRSRSRLHSYRSPRSREREIVHGRGYGQGRGFSHDYGQEGYTRGRYYVHNRGRRYNKCEVRYLRDLTRRSPTHGSSRYRGHREHEHSRDDHNIENPKDRQRERESPHRRGNNYPEPLNELERAMIIEAAKTKIESQIKYGIIGVDIPENQREISCPKTPSHLESSRNKSPGRSKSYPKTPSRWESPPPRTPGRCEPRTPGRCEPRTPGRCEPKTPGRWESHPKTPSRWESRPKSRWEPLHKTPGRWESFHPKTPSRQDSSHPKAPSRWESSHPKTPSRQESSHAKTPRRQELSHPKTPSRQELSHPKTPSRQELSHPKTPNRQELSGKGFSNKDGDKVSSPTRKFSPENSSRFNKWNKEENSKSGEPKIGNSLTEMENFVEIEKQKILEKMKERNKEFLKPVLN